MIVSQATARAGQLRPGMIAGVGVQSLFQSLGGESQSLASRRHLQGLEIQFGNRLRTYERFDFLGDFALQVRGEPFFSAS
jgi:hypothetical protein